MAASTRDSVTVCNEKSFMLKGGTKYRSATFIYYNQKGCKIEEQVYGRVPGDKFMVVIIQKSEASTFIAEKKLAQQILQSFRYL
ncbi:MAG: hypothetical protein N2035_02030 [Chthoniobacterales bacterium]|nr:hypothetical protein [Chthoniobacterales bacterium]